MTPTALALGVFDTLGAPLLAAVFVALLVVEARWPLRARVEGATRHIARNVALGAVGGLVSRLAVLPWLVAVAAFCARARFGVAQWIALTGAPSWLCAGVALLLLDWSIYVWHRLNHSVPLLWRFHRVHHTDLDVDVSTALRFHAGELLFSIAYRSVQVALIGPAPLLLVAYEIAMQLATELQHASVRLPPRADAWLARVLVTPRMHGIHHDVAPALQNANWSVVLSVWDRLHGSLRLDVDTVAVGVPEARHPRDVGIVRLLVMPLEARADRAA